MTIAEMNSPVAENITKISNEKGLKQYFIAEKSGINWKTYSDMLNGRCIIKPFQIYAIADALGVTVNEVFGLGAVQ